MEGKTIEIALPIAGEFITAGNEQEYFAHKSKQDVRRWTLENDTIEDDNRQRKDYYEKSHSIIQAWVGFLIVLIISQFSLRPLGLNLGREEFIAVVVSLSGSIFGFWSLVGRYLFDPRNTNKKVAGKNKKAITRA